jgi:anaerobic magnesium-protoporphyrin IX monomethyl ester cyclase
VNELNRIPVKKKMVLISPPEMGISCPRGILSLGTFLESKGYPTAVVALGNYLKEKLPRSAYKEDVHREKLKSVLADILREHDPKIVGVSCMTTDYYTCAEILKICKELNETIITVMGGIHPTFLDTDCIRQPFTDIVVRGEGEWTLLELVSALENGGFHPPYTALHQINGLTFKENGKVIRTPDRELGNLYELPPLDFGLLPDEFVRTSLVFGMMSRGCAFDCHFCADKRFWKRVRYFPIGHIINEMEVLSRSYKNPMTALEDNMVYIGSREFSQVCEEIKTRKIEIAPHFYVMTRVDSIVNDQGLKDMDGTGIQYVLIGIESGSPNVLKMMNKKTTPEIITAGCEKLRKSNRNPTSIWILGHPGDTPAETQRSLEFLEYLLKNDLLHSAHFSYFIPWPGTRFFDDPKKYGIELLSDDWSTWDYRKEGEERRSMCQSKDFSADEMAVCYRKANEIITRYSAHPYWLVEAGLSVGTNRK